MQKTEITIIGAGIGGLATALALQQRDFRVRIYEQAAALTEIGAGLTLPANATRVLIDLGLRDALLPFIIATQDQAVRHFQTGADLVRVERGAKSERQFGAPYWQLHRADLHRALHQTVSTNDSETISLNQRLIGLSQDNNSVRLEFANREPILSEIVIACDGTQSIVRNLLHNETAPLFTGFIAYRGLAPVEKLPDSVMRPDSALYIAPGNMFARYAVRDRALINYVAYAERSGWTEEGWNVPANITEVHREFEAFHSEVLQIIDNTPPDSCFKWALLSREPLPSWSVGRVALLGDAAHPVLPSLGHGAVMAIEDAVVMARALEASADYRQAFARFEQARVERCTNIMRQSEAALRSYHSPTPELFNESRLINEETAGLLSYDATRTPI